MKITIMKPSHSLDIIDLEFDDETMRPEKATEAPRDAGIDPSTMKNEAMTPKT